MLCRECHDELALIDRRTVRSGVPTLFREVNPHGGVHQPHLLSGADGSTVVQAPLWEEALVVGTLESDDLRMQRYGLPLLADERLELVRRELDRIIAERAGIDGQAERT